MYARNKTNLHLVFHILFREHAGELEFSTFERRKSETFSTLPP